jgi:hypothetical protein
MRKIIQIIGKRTRKDDRRLSGPSNMTVLRNIVAKLRR